MQALRHYCNKTVMHPWLVVSTLCLQFLYWHVGSMMGSLFVVLLFCVCVFDWDLFEFCMVNVCCFFFKWFYSQFSCCHPWNLLSVCGWGCGFYLIPWASAYAFPCQVTSCHFSNVSCIYFYLCVITLVSAPLPSLPVVYLKRQLVSALSQSVCLPQLCEFLFIAPFFFFVIVFSSFDHNNEGWFISL